MTITIKIKKLWILWVSVSSVVSLAGMAPETHALAQRDLSPLTMAEHEALVRFAQETRGQASFVELCALCEKTFPAHSSMACMYVYLFLNQIERNEYEGTALLRRLNPAEFFKRCPDYSFIPVNADILQIFSQVVALPQSKQTTVDPLVFGDIFQTLLTTNDIVFMEYLQNFLATLRPDIDRLTIDNEDELLCRTIFMGSLIGVNLLLDYTSIDLNRVFVYNRTGKTTPLLLAVMRSSLPMVDTLVRRGADPEFGIPNERYKAVECDVIPDDTDAPLGKKSARARRPCVVSACPLDALAHEIPDPKRDHPGFHIYSTQQPPLSAIALAMELSSAWFEQDRAQNPYSAIVARLYEIIDRKRFLAMIDTQFPVTDTLPIAMSSGTLKKELALPDLMTVGGARQPSIVDSTGCWCHHAKKSSKKDKKNKEK